jgi:hypothetical protein
VSILGNKEMSLPMIINTPVALVICIAFVMLTRWRMSVRSQKLASNANRIPVER